MEVVCARVLGLDSYRLDSQEGNDMYLVKYFTINEIAEVNMRQIVTNILSPWESKFMAK